MYFAIVSSASVDNLASSLSDQDEAAGAPTRPQGHGLRGRTDNFANTSKILLRVGEEDEVYVGSTTTLAHAQGDGAEILDVQTAAVKPFVNSDRALNEEGRRHHGHSSGSGSRETTHRKSPSLPGGGVDMTLSELQEMAARQQHQIESQQQILVAKEQRLKYLKQQEAKQQQLASDNDRLRKLRDKVEAQEMKLKKLRALRGQVEQQKASNGNLNYELESIKALFNEKEKELSMAVAKVEEMTRQLEDIRSGRVKANTNSQSPAAMAELEKLKKELQIRNKLNQQQSSKMSSNRELLVKRKDELSRMDNRIHELQARLKKKRAINADQPHQTANQPSKPNLNSKSRVAPNVAAVEPYRQELLIEDDPTKPGFVKQDPKYKSLPVSSKFSYADKGNKPGETNNNSIDYSAKRYDADRTDEYSIPLVVSVDSSNKPLPNGMPSPKQSPVGPGRPVPGQVYPPSTIPTSSHVQPSVPTSSHNNTAPMNNVPHNTANTGRSGMAHFMPRPFGSTYSTSRVPDRGSGGVPNEHPQYDLQEEIRQAGSGQSSPGSVEGNQTVGTKFLPQPAPPHSHPSGQPQAKVSNKDVQPPTKGFSNESQVLNKSPPSEGGHHVNKGPPPVPSKPSTKPGIPSKQPQQNQGQNTHKNTVPVPTTSSDSSDTEQPCVSVSQGIQKFSHLIANNSGGGFSNLNHASALGAVRQQAPTYRYASKSDIANTYLGKLDSEALEKYKKNVLSLHRDLDSNSKQSESGSPPESRLAGKPASANEEDKDSLSPLSSQSSSISTPSPQSPQRSQNYAFDFATTPPHADVASDKMSHKPNTPKNIRRRHSDSDNEEVGKALHKYNINTNSKQTPAQENQMLTMDNISGAVEIQATAFNDNIPETVLLDSKGNIIEVADTSRDNANNNSQESLDKAPAVTIEVSSDSGTKSKKKSNLKSAKSRKHSNRVSFDPLALLLDASLEGELDLVRRCAHQVENVSASNDEGITALHNAICAGHYDIVTFLTEFGCDVNSPDSDGWTPLHCAASCNNLPMVKFLVEHGACIFATTISDHETAAEKCEEDEDGYDGCSDYLYSVQEKLGIMNGGAVYAVFDYRGQHSDELNLQMGDKFTVLKKGDDHEKEWWWARLGDKEGYIPRNLLGLKPRVLPKTQPNGDV